MRVKESAISEIASGDDRRSADFIDIRYYVSILLLWWREIVLVVFAIAGAAAVAQWRQGPVYEAVADVAIIRTQRDVPSVLPTDVQSILANHIPKERDSLAATMLGLVHQGGLAQHVQSRLGERFAGVPAASLLGRIGADLDVFRDETMSDLIRITATSGAPQEAADLATIWAEEYVARMNRLLEWPQSRLDTIRSEMASALQASNRSQQQLETFVAQNNLDALRRQLAANEQAVNLLWQARNQAMVARAADLDVSAALEALSAMHKNPLAVAIEDIEAKSRTLAAGVEAAANRMALLTAERDADRAVLQALREEVIDLQVHNASALSRVRLASTAVVPAGPASRSPASVATVAGVAALPAVVVLVLLANLMGVKPVIASLACFIARRRMR